MQIFPMQIYIKNDQLFMKIKQISNTREFQPAIWPGSKPLYTFFFAQHFSYSAFFLLRLVTNLTLVAHSSTLFLFLFSKSKPYLTITFTFFYLTLLIYVIHWCYAVMKSYNLAIIYILYHKFLLFFISLFTSLYLTWFENQDVALQAKNTTGNSANPVDIYFRFICSSARNCKKLFL